MSADLPWLKSFRLLIHFRTSCAISGDGQSTRWFLTRNSGRYSPSIRKTGGEGRFRISHSVSGTSAIIKSLTPVSSAAIPIQAHFADFYFLPTTLLAIAHAQK